MLQIPPGLANLTPPPSNSSSSSATAAYPPGVDTSVLAALKAADSKRPAPPRHAFGHAGSLAAVGGSLGGLPSPIHPTSSPHTASSPASPLGDTSPAYTFSGSQQQQASSLASQRRKRAAATEQGRVMKKLKTKGHLLEQDIILEPIVFQYMQILCLLCLCSFPRLPTLLLVKKCAFQYNMELFS